MGWGFAIRVIGSGQSYVLRFDVTSRLIGGSLSDCLSSSSKSQDGILQVMDCSAIRIPSLSITGRHPQPTGGPVGVEVLPFCRGAVGVFYCPSRQSLGNLICDVKYLGADGRYGAPPYQKQFLWSRTSKKGIDPLRCLASTRKTLILYY